MVPEQQKPRRVRITNDGGPGFCTQITDADTGQPIDKVFHIRLVDIGVQDLPKAILWTYSPVIDVIANAEIVEQCLYCGAQKPEEKTLPNDARLKLTVDDVVLDLSIEKLKRLQALQRATRGDYIDPAEALFAFAGWLSSRDGVSRPFSACHETTQIAQLVKAFNEAQGWDIDDQHYNNVIKRLRANYPD